MVDIVIVQRGMFSQMVTDKAEHHWGVIKNPHILNQATLFHRYTHIDPLILRIYHIAFLSHYQCENVISPSHIYQSSANTVCILGGLVSC